MEKNTTIITKELLEEAYRKHFNREKFLEVDPCGLVYELKEHTCRQLDLELGALFVAMITWGNRKAIRKAALHMLQDEMEWQPARFILEGKYSKSYLSAKNGCVYRTLNREKFIQVCENIRIALANENVGLDTLTIEYILRHKDVDGIISTLCQWLAPAKLGKPGVSACKRICMYLRWMVRQDVPDLGLWKSIDQGKLYAIMDVHVCKLTSSILQRKQADWKACQELSGIFRKWSNTDPLFYDIALMTIADHGF